VRFHFLYNLVSEIFLTVKGTEVGQDSSVGIATGYGLDGLGIKSRWGRDFHTRPDWPWGLPRLLYNRYRVSFPGVKRPGRGVEHSPPICVQVKERVEIYLLLPLWTFIACYRVIFIFTFKKY
jgi:hypothetical protein